MANENYWWVRMGYPSFAADSRTVQPGQNSNATFPKPGQVVKYYREQTAKDTGTTWTQADLAHVLGVTTKAVNEMENRDKGLDSIERRRVLVELFAIPPLLMDISIQR